MTIHTYAPAFSAHDAWENGGNVTINSATLPITGGTRYGGVLFPTTSDPIPPGTTVTSATLKYFCVNTSNDDPDQTWKGHAHQSSAAFQEGATSDISQRYTASETTASVSDIATGVGTGVRAIDVTPIVQELLDFPGWTSVSPLTLLCKGNGAGAACQMRAFDGGGNYFSLEIDIPDTEAAGPLVGNAARLKSKLRGLV